jgi:hypothetical protein
MGTRSIGHEMRIAETLSLISEIEDAVEVAEWRVGTRRVWPLVRHRIWWTYDSGAIEARASAPPRSALRRLGEVGAAFGTQRAFDRRRSAAVGPADVVALGDSISRVLVGGVWYDRWCEPILEAMEGSGLTTLHLEANHVYRRPRHRPSVPIQPRMDAARLRGRLKRTSSGPPPVGYDQLGSILRRHGLDSGPLAWPRVGALAEDLDIRASWFKGRLRQVQPRLAVVVDNGPQPMAFCAACRDLGIPVVELQHGVQGPTHWAYARWSRVPLDGYEMLPDLYWVWSEHEKDEIDRWSAPLRRHRALVGGNPWIEACRRPDPELASLLATAAIRKDPAPSILVTLQPGLTTDRHLASLVDAMRRAPGEWRWWIRAHPGMSADDVELARSSLDSSGARIERSQATSLPLPVVLRASDVHVTVRSSVVLEAEMLGVPSIGLDLDVMTSYPEHAARHWLVHASNGDELLAAIQRLLAAPAPARITGDLGRTLHDSALDLLDQIEKQP